MSMLHLLFLFALSTKPITSVKENIIPPDFLISTGISTSSSSSSSLWISSALSPAAFAPRKSLPNRRLVWLLSQGRSTYASTSSPMCRASSALTLACRSARSHICGAGFSMPSSSLNKAGERKAMILRSSNTIPFEYDQLHADLCCWGCYLRIRLSVLDTNPVTILRLRSAVTLRSSAHNHKMASNVYELVE
jgi:hypothetical protein